MDRLVKWYCTLINWMTRWQINTGKIFGEYGSIINQVKQLRASDDDSVV